MTRIAKKQWWIKRKYYPGLNPPRLTNKMKAFRDYKGNNQAAKNVAHAKMALYICPYCQDVGHNDFDCPRVKQLKHQMYQINMGFVFEEWKLSVDGYLGSLKKPRMSDFAKAKL